MHDRAYCKTPTEDQSCRPQQRSLAPASFTCCLFEFSNMRKYIKSIERGEAHLQGTAPYAGRRYCEGRGFCQHSANTMGTKSARFPEEKENSTWPNPETISSGTSCLKLALQQGEPLPQLGMLGASENKPVSTDLMDSSNWTETGASSQKLR